MEQDAIPYCTKDIQRSAVAPDDLVTIDSITPKNPAVVTWLLWLRCIRVLTISNLGPKTPYTAAAVQRGRHATSVISVVFSS
jgi:hypothetical protein